MIKDAHLGRQQVNFYKNILKKRHRNGRFGLLIKSNEFCLTLKEIINFSVSYLLSPC